MKTKKFNWGQVLQTFTYDFDGETLEVVKYHPWKTNGCQVLSGTPNFDEIQFHVDDWSESFMSMQTLLIAWVAYRNLGRGNQDALIQGIARALEVQNP